MKAKDLLPELAKLDKEQAKMLTERLACEVSLAFFVKKAWPYFDPQPFEHTWHIDAICKHLEAVSRGEIKRLLINIPPGMSKSSLISVCWPAWVWAQRKIDHLSGPQVQFMFSSYAQTLSERDSVKMRRLIESPWYQKLWGERYTLVGDQNTKRKYENSKNGFRLATSVDGTQTGDGGKILVIDDPLNAKEANSAASIAGVISWWTETMPTRLRDPKNGAKVIIMQRLHENDLSGFILENDTEGEWVHLCIPMRYEADRHCITPIWEDPRQVDGDLLCPQRYGEPELVSMEKEMGTYGVAGQLQQRPTPRGGGIIKREHWRIWPPEDWPEDIVTFPRFEYIIASVDTAYTAKQENDYSACTVWGIFSLKGIPKIMLIEAWKERLEFNALVDKIIATAIRRRIDTLLIESKASGISVIQEISRLCAEGDFTIVPINPGSQDKVARVYSIQPIFEGGVIYAPDRKYADVVISEFESFPKGKNDDLVDCSTQGIKYLRDTGMALLSRESDRLLLEDHMYQPEEPNVAEMYGI